MIKFDSYSHAALLHIARKNKIAAERLLYFIAVSVSIGFSPGILKHAVEL